MAEDTTLQPSVRDALAKNAADLSTLSLALSRKQVSRPGHPLNNAFAEDTLVSLQDGMVYAKITSNHGLEKDSQTRVQAYNGQTYTMLRPEDTRPDGTPEHKLARTPGKLALQQGRFIRIPYFEAIGFAVPFVAESSPQGGAITPSLLTDASDDWRIQQTAPVKLDGADTLRVEVKTTDASIRALKKVDIAASVGEWRASALPEVEIEERVRHIRAMQQASDQKLRVYYLDPKMNYAIIRQEERDVKGRLISETINEAFISIAGRDIWLPKRITNNIYSNNNEGEPQNEPLVTLRIDVLAVDTTPKPRELFTPTDHTPGTIFLDFGKQGNITYVAPGTARDLEDSLESARRIMAGGTPAAPADNNTRGDGPTVARGKELGAANLRAATGTVTASSRSLLVAVVLAVVGVVVGTFVAYRMFRR